ncbi:MAG: hypothetical protein NVSMB38_26890 [Ktedonobacteraceae bacterium]
MLVPIHIRIRIAVLTIAYRAVWSMTGASPVTTILTKTAWLCHAIPCRVVTGLAPVMLSMPCFFLAIISTILILMRMGVIE